MNGTETYSDALLPPDDNAELRSPRPAAIWDGGKALWFFLLAAVGSIALGVSLFQPLGFYGSVIVSEIVGFLIVPIVVGRFLGFPWRHWLTAPHLSGSFWLNNNVVRSSVHFVLRH